MLLKKNWSVCLFLSIVNSMKRLIIVLSLVFIFSVAGYSQCPTMPPGFLCITQAAGNQAREDNRVRKVLEDEVIPELKASIASEKENVVKAQKTAQDNQAKLEAALHSTDVKLAEKTGQLIECKAFAVRDAALIEFLAKNQRSKQNGLINIKLGGN